MPKQSASLKEEFEKKFATPDIRQGLIWRSGTCSQGMPNYDWCKPREVWKWFEKALKEQRKEGYWEGANAQRIIDKNL